MTNPATKIDPRPEPPEEPLASECCGSGCATCVFDIFEQQRENYEKELRRWRDKYGGDDADPVRLKSTRASSSIGEAVNIAALRERLQQQGADDDDEDEGDFHDEDLDVSSSSSSLRSTDASRFANSCTVNLTQPPASVARSSALALDDQSEHLLTFRMDERDWSRIVQVEQEEKKKVEEKNFCMTRLHLPTENEGEGQLFHLDGLRPGDTVEVLHLPPRYAVESFLRHFAGSDEEIRTASRAGSLLFEEESSSSSSSLTLSNGIFLDIGRFPFVDAPLPPWLEKCSSLLRNQYPELRTSRGLQILSLGHLMRTVVDVYSWSALQRRLLGKMLDVARSAASAATADDSDQQKQRLKLEVAALESLVRLPTASVHEWVRSAWVVSSTSSGSFGGETVGELIAATKSSSSSSSSSAAVEFPESLLVLPIKKCASLHREQSIGSVEFILRCCFFEGVHSRLFAPNAPLRDFASTSTERKFLTLPRLLEVAPPLRGRLFSVAGTTASPSHQLTLLSNFENGQRLWAQRFGGISDIAPPPWAGIVSARLGGVSSSSSSGPLFLRGSALLSQSSMAKKRMLQSTVGAANNSNKSPQMMMSSTSVMIRNETRSFADALGALTRLDPVLLLCAGTGLAPFRFFLEQATKKHPIFLPEISLVLGLRRPPLGATQQMISTWLRLGVLKRAHVAVSSSCAVPEEQKFTVHANRQVPALLPSLLLPGIVVTSSSSSSSSPLRVFSCGPPSFHTACKDAVGASGCSSEIVWSDDDWSS